MLPTKSEKKTKTIAPQGKCAKLFIIQFNPLLLSPPLSPLTTWFPHRQSDDNET